MKKVMSVAVIALMMAGSSAFACSNCGCETKKADKTDKAKTECGSSCKKTEKKQTACGESKKGDQGKKTACNGSSHKHDGDNKKAA
jgi:hypothetical protein